MTEKSMVNFLKSHQRENSISFHMPGHKGNDFFERIGKKQLFDDITGCDITEISGADNLMQPEGIIENIMSKYRKLYKCKESFLLVNGSSAGIIGSILACVGRGEKLILGGNSHKSAISGLILSGGIPVYVQPEFDEIYNVSGKINPVDIKEAIDRNKDAKAVLITSPNYYGVCSDIEEIAKITHDAGMVLIVDQAHGAHLKFFDDAMKLREDFDDMKRNSFDGGSKGADIVIMSTHKTLASFTQTAIVNVYTDRVDKTLLGDMVHMVQSSSPSYLLMMSLDINADIMLEKGNELINRWLRNIYRFKEAAEKIPYVRIMNNEMLDISKMNIDMSQGGIDGSDLEQRLMKRNIFVELVCGNMVMAMTGIGNKDEDYEKLLAALEEISDEITSEKMEEISKDDNINVILSHNGEVEKADYIFCEIPKKRVSVHHKEAIGLVCASAITPYPPGIPLILPGEKFTEEILAYAYHLRCSGQKVLGMTEEGYVIAGI